MRTYLARYFVEWIFRRPARIFFVYGIRRSGNHACIRWLVNALENGPTALNESRATPNFYITGTSRTVFINDITSFHNQKYVNMLRHNKQAIRNATFVVISCEDQDLTYRNGWRIPRRSEAILVRRGALNTMASRFQSLNREARAGRGLSQQSMGERFFSILRANLSMEDVLVWQFENWYSDPRWRQKFLEQLGLQGDFTPTISDEGKGSSFSGLRIQPRAPELEQRFNMVEPWDPWVTFVRESASTSPDIFRVDELDAIRRMSHGQRTRP